MPNELTKLWYSQAALSAWQNCPLKFKYRYLDGLYWPIVSAGKVGEHMELGRKFHLLAQRYFGGCPAAAPAEPLLTGWLARLHEFLPLGASEEYLAEYELRSNQDGLRLLAKYDLLAVAPGQVTIYDWKTDERPPRSGFAATPQTRLYLYLLAVTGLFGAETARLRMIYWNPRFPEAPLTIPYSLSQQEKDGAWLKKVVKEIRETEAFPATLLERNCRFCEYRPVCHGLGLEESAEVELPELEEVDWEQVQEIALQGVNLP